MGAIGLNSYRTPSTAEDQGFKLIRQAISSFWIDNREISLKEFNEFALSILLGFDGLTRRYRFDHAE